MVNKKQEEKPSELNDIKAVIAARARRKQEEQKQAQKEPSPTPVSAGPVDKIVDMVFNPSQEKTLEFTVLDHNQVRLIPQLGIIDAVWEYCIEVASFR